MKDSTPFKLKISAIMDDFTYHSFKYEADVLQLTPALWREQCIEFRPDCLFIESAWQGVDKLWSRKVCHGSPEIFELIDWCKQKSIPVVFWNKEDPVSFSGFLEVASRSDFIFTTDMDCIPKYKKICNHDHVYLLPFAAQPKMHNPIEKYDRKDAFCFAGAYYLRFPERQQDFDRIVQTAYKSKPVEIFDRNYENNILDFKFPKQYESMIKGTLPFEEIEKAYKGYQYGITINSVKQSQTMFARRACELMASNTVVVSNFSRALRFLFGDLIVSTDNSTQVSKYLDFLYDVLNYKKFRLLGLRKILSEHTYKHRLNYILTKVFGAYALESSPKIALIGYADSIVNVDYLISILKRQSYQNCKLYIILDQGLDVVSPILNISFFRTVSECLNGMLADNFDYCAFLNHHDHYGDSYVMDLALSTQYIDAQVIGKVSYYKFIDGKVELQNKNQEYQSVDQFQGCRAIFHHSIVDIDFMNQLICSMGRDFFQHPNSFGIDEFNYCMNGVFADKEDLIIYVNDLEILNQGINLSKGLIPYTEKLVPADFYQAPDKQLPFLSALEIYKCLDPNPEPLLGTGHPFHIEYTDDKLVIHSMLGQDERDFFYLKKIFSREELNLVHSSFIEFEVEHSFKKFQAAFEFLDSNHNKIGYFPRPIWNGKTFLLMPHETVYIKIGFRIEGSGEARLGKLILGDRPDTPLTNWGGSNILLLTNCYPQYDNLYSCGFIHSRVKMYQEQGSQVDVFRLSMDDVVPYREFENIDVCTGTTTLLEQTLKNGQYEHVLVHFLSPHMWEVLQKYLDTIKITVWIHGIEIQPWYRRSFEFENVTAKDKMAIEDISHRKIKFWQAILNKNHENLRYVFVSSHFRQECEEDLEMNFPTDQTFVIHNYINTNQFVYTPKQREDRLNILSIRPYVNNTYANDLTVKAILLLSTEVFFDELKFTIIGDGMLFDKLTSPLRNFKNVILKKKFLSQSEIAQLHKQNGIFLVPTRMDSQGVSRDEAMASGLVPITNNVAAIPEFVDETCGMVVPAEDYVGLANAMKDLYYNPEKFLALSKAAHLRVSKQSGFEETIQREIALM